MISCSEAMRRLWEYLDDMVDGGDRSLIEEHLARCRRCCGELEFAQELRRFLAEAARRGQDDVPDDVLRRLAHTLEELEP
jgi:anti-sigma factor (TIGR02949 family)